ncbi:MAG: hypothetical protein ACKOXS_07675 [Actinomycetes bacterium]
MRWPNFPKQFAETKRFTLGRIRNFTLSPETNKVFFLKNIPELDEWSYLPMHPYQV